MPGPNYDTQAKQHLSEQIAEIENSDLGSLGSAYNDYIKKLKELNALTAEQYKNDDFGLKKQFTAEDLRRFKALYKDCAVFGERLLKRIGNTTSPLSREIVDKLQDMLSRDSKILNSVDEKALESGTVSLQQIVDAARIRTVDISGTELVSAGRSMSSRLPFKYIEPDGTEIVGVFTPKKEFDIEAMYDSFVEDLKNGSPYMASLLAEYKKAAIAYTNFSLRAAGKDPNAATNGEKIFKCIEELVETDGEYEISKVFQHITEVLPAKGAEFGEFIANTANKDQLDIFAKKCGRLINSIDVNYNGAEISDKSRIDSRNAAMSSVADLLGVSHLICKAVPMKLVKDGVETEGTFMAMARGVDVLNPADRYMSNAYAPGSPAFKNTDGFMDVSAIQIVDVICGNTDRHGANMLYQFTAQGGDPTREKFAGVQGIDNDTSFGEYVPDAGDEVTGTQFVCFDNLKVISRSMYKRVMSLDTEMLKFTLREHGLSEPQVKAAGRRLNMLRNYIQDSVGKYNSLSKQEKQKYKDVNMIMKGTIRVIEDEDFKKLKLETLAKCDKGVGDEKNTFSKIAKFRQHCRSAIGSKQALSVKTIQSEQLYVLGEAETEWAADIAAKLDRATSLNRTSDPFEAIRAAAERYKEFCLLNQGSVLSADLKALQQKYLKDIRDTSDGYLQFKNPVKNPGSYTRRRINTVSAILGEASQKLGDNTRYADGKLQSEYADRALDDFNAKMRKMAQDIAVKNGMPVKKEIIAAKGLSGPGIR